MKRTGCLIEELKDIQVRAGLTGNEFARRLGISPQLYHMTRTGKREIGLEVLKAIVRACPELDRDVLFFLRGDANILATATSDLSPTPSQTAQNKILGLLRALCRRFYHWLIGSDTK